MSDSTYLGSETLPPDGYLQPRRYKITAICTRCEQEFSWVTSKMDGKDRPCPKRSCKEAVLEEEIEKRARNMARIIESGIPPGHIGDKQIVKNIDKTAEVVMQDYGLTDLKDNVREGDTLAPKLPPKQQSAADNFFGNGQRQPGQMSAQARRLQARALAGAYRGYAVNPANLMPGVSAGAPPLRLAKTEAI